MRPSRAILLLGLMAALPLSGQKSRVVSALQLIEDGKYTEAKETIELAIENERTSGWPRTHFTKGYLCQTAWESGFESKDDKKTGVYPQQLYVAYAAYEKALALDANDRIRTQVVPMYYTLSNDFQLFGNRLYAQKDFAGATRAFEHALLIATNPLLSVETDTNLVYNVALSAFAAQDWEKARGYLEGLNESRYSSNVPLLLYRSHLAVRDTLGAGRVLEEAMTSYAYDSALVLHFVDHLVETREEGRALAILDSALVHHPDVYVFPWTKGLILVEEKQYEQAIASLERAQALAPGVEGICRNLGVCYYNMGVEKNEEALRVQSNSLYQRTRQEARSLFGEAKKWLETAKEISPTRETLALLLQVEKQLR